MRKILYFAGAFLITGLVIFGVNNLNSTPVGAAENERGFISVQTEASEEFAPDIAKVTLSVETSDKDVTKATELNKKAAQNSIEAVKKLLNTSKGEQIKTISFNVSPEYSYRSGVRTFIQYNATNSFEVKIKDTSKLGKIISTALDNGANNVQGLNYMLETNEENCNKLIKKASQNAKQRATTTAAAIGATIADVKNIDAQCSINAYYTPRYAMKTMAVENAMDSAGSAAVPTEEGTIKLRAFVNAAFYVK